MATSVRWSPVKFGSPSAHSQILDFNVVIKLQGQ
jgi:hypothetical protein